MGKIKMKEKKVLQNKTRKKKDGGSGYSRDRKIVSIYMQATGSSVQVFDSNFHPLETDNGVTIEQSICRYCVGAACNGNIICREMHINAIRESSRQGKSQIYQCGLGLMFWVSPFYSDGKFNGALRGSGFLSPNANISTVSEKCNGTILTEEFVRIVSSLPVENTEKFVSLAEMMLLCAESLSTGRENHHEILRLRSQQQNILSSLVEELKEKHPEGEPLPGYPLDKERQLITSLRRGDKKEAERFLNELLAALVFTNPEHFQYIQLRAMEIAVLLFRTGIHSITNSVMENNTRFLKQIQEAKTIEEIIGILHAIVENIAGQIASFQGIPHASAMRKAEHFIRKNYTRKISLHEIAEVAGLSAPYFSTIFKEEMGENLSKYIKRLRVEKAIKMLFETDFSLSEISAACCFEDQSWFSKIFKAFTGISPGKYRNQGGIIIKNTDKAALSKNRKK